MGNPPRIHGDFADIIRALQSNAVEFMIVGAHALAAHGVVRSTGFDDAMVGAVETQIDGVRFRVPSRQTLLVNKRASGRPKDLEDVTRLEELDEDS